MQVGAGAYKPRVLCPPGQRRHRLDNGLEVRSLTRATSAGTYLMPQCCFLVLPPLSCTQSNTAAIPSSTASLPGWLEWDILQVEHFDFAPGLTDRIALAALVISHAVSCRSPLTASAALHG